MTTRPRESKFRLPSTHPNYKQIVNDVADRKHVILETPQGTLTLDVSRLGFGHDQKFLVIYGREIVADGAIGLFTDNPDRELTIMIWFDTGEVLLKLGW